MADDKSKRDYRDRSRINTSEEYEMAYWKKALKVSVSNSLAPFARSGLP